LNDEGEDVMSAQLRKITSIVSLLLVITLTGCLSLPGSAPAEDVNAAAYTQAAETIVAELTQNAPQVSPTSEGSDATPVEEQIPPTATEEPLPPTSTPEPTETLPPTSTPEPTETPFPTEPPTPTATYTPTEPTEPNFVLYYEDDFSASYGWPVDKMNSAKFHYTAGGYAINSSVKDDIIFAVRSDAFDDTRVDVSATTYSGSLDSYYGVVCRFINGGNYYILAVGGDGWYGIGKKVLSQLTFIEEGIDTESIIHTAGLSNEIRADCIKDTLTLYVNGEKMLEVQDKEFSAGAIGLGVGNRTNFEVEILFDDFAVYQPE
jgi:hypothetical protein